MKRLHTDFDAWPFVGLIFPVGFDESVLVLLLDNDGDAHIGEFGTVDLRIGSIDAQAGLPASVQETFGWPVE